VTIKPRGGSSWCGIALALLASDDVGWFHRFDRGNAIRQTFRAALDEVASRLGPDVATWQWNRLHTLVQRHFLCTRGELGLLLDRNGCPAPGDATTVCSTTSDANHAAVMGASYRMVADLADGHQGLWAISIPGASGHPGSRHYDDQVGPWSEGEFHYLSLTDAPNAQDPILTLTPVS
jgi:penicillin amidase